MVNVETYWAENTEVRIRNLMSTAREQIEYKAVHGDYLSIRNNSLLNVSGCRCSIWFLNKYPWRTISMPELRPFWSRLKHWKGSTTTRSSLQLCRRPYRALTLHTKTTSRRSRPQSSIWLCRALPMERWTIPKIPSYPTWPRPSIKLLRSSTILRRRSRRS